MLVVLVIRCSITFMKILVVCYQGRIFLVRCFMGGCTFVGWIVILMVLRIVGAEVGKVFGPSDWLDPYFIDY